MNTFSEYMLLTANLVYQQRNAILLNQQILSFICAPHKGGEYKTTEKYIFRGIGSMWKINNTSQNWRRKRTGAWGTDDWMDTHTRACTASTTRGQWAYALCMRMMHFCCRCTTIITIIIFIDLNFCPTSNVAHVSRIGFNVRAQCPPDAGENK